MDLPNEILVNILNRLTQRFLFLICSIVCKKWNLIINQPPFYTTIHIRSEVQWKKVIKDIKEKNDINNNDKHFSHYVQNLIFHYKPISSKQLEISTFPSLQSISGLCHSPFLAEDFSKLYLEIKQPTDYYYWAKSKEWIENFNHVKYHIKTLTIYYAVFLCNQPYSQEGQKPLETIYLKPTKNESKSIRFGINSNIPHKMLVLPTTSLTNLVKLNLELSFCTTPPKFFINEYTFENIHQSCPLLESLSIDYMFMDLSDELDVISNNSNIIPAQHLKSIYFKNCHFNHSYCFNYFCIKYPHLETLSIDLMLQNMSFEEKMRYQKRFLNILRHFPTLKTLYYIFWLEYTEINPYYSFFKSLNKYLKKLTNLEYSFPLTPYGRKKLYTVKMDSVYTNVSIDDRTSLLHKQHLNFNILNQLTHLSAGISDLLNLASKLLLKSLKTIVLSTTLQELKMRDTDKSFHIHELEKLIYIYDWIDMFPNLLLLDIVNCAHIVDDNSAFFKENYKDFDIRRSSHTISNDIHVTINTLKCCNNKLNKLENDKTIYKLQKLKIYGGCLWFKNGFNDFLKKCHHLQKLNLKGITFITIATDPFHELCLDLSHLYLESLNIFGNFYSSPMDYANKKSIDIYNLYESTTGSKPEIKHHINNKHDMDSNYQPFSLSLKCKFIESFD
ncbi:unnamed protein product [Cunninghamella blakesleeana]